MAGSTDVGITKAYILVRVACGAIDKGHWRDRIRVTGETVIMDFWIIRIGTKNRAMTVNGTIGATATDKGSMINHMGNTLIPVTIKAMQGDAIA